tara:strand:+ start:9789 stop:10508 length:720 start_codon:yes stop_codon:yes gene_type:complete
MEIVRENEDLFSAVISEPDRGQSDALNKGFSHARGEYFTWLNSDDVFCAGAMAFCLRFIKEKKSEWYAANMVYVDSETRISKCCESGRFENEFLKFGVLNVFGPSTIFKREVYDKIGPIRTDFHYCMDTEYWWRMASSGYSYIRIPVYLWALRLHVDAKTSGSLNSAYGSVPDRMLRENELYKNMYYPSVSNLKRRVGLLLVKVFRILNFSYIRSLFMTVKYRGKRLGDLVQAKGKHGS